MMMMMKAQRAFLSFDGDWNSSLFADDVYREVALSRGVSWCLMAIRGSRFEVEVVSMAVRRQRREDRVGSSEKAAASRLTMMFRSLAECRFAEDEGWDWYRGREGASGCRRRDVDDSTAQRREAEGRERARRAGRQAGGRLDGHDGSLSRLVKLRRADDGTRGGLSSDESEPDGQRTRANGQSFASPTYLR